MAYKQSPREPIAIIGTGCRFPGSSTSPSKLWDLLISPRELSRTVPTERSFNADGYYHPNGERHGASNVTKSYFLEEDPRHFDAGFFSIAPREAESIDPQQRLLLETVYEAMENAGLSLHTMKGSQTSVYCGAMSADYMDVQTRDLESTSQYMITGTSRALLANRISYYFDWHGPSIAVDTACSSSLAAIHLGVQSLRNGEATTSCVAGSNVILGPDAYLAATSLHLLSPSGRSQMWDDGADGYARGEGICAFLMKTLSQALKDGDRIDGIIRETCVNSDGRTKGIALPSAEAQMALISTAYKNAGLDLLRAEDRPQYIEAHGTGTKAGDPLEARALSDTFFPPGISHDERPNILVGSIKTILGHTEGTAGAAGILKTILAMRHQIIPPNQHLHNLNPDVVPYYKKLRIPTLPEAWPPAPAGQPLRASVNGFGSGGTNCHAIVESYVPEIHDNGPWGRTKPLTSISPRSTLDKDYTSTPLVFSANSESALVAMLERYAHYLEKNEVPIERLALTLNSHRSTLPVRLVIVGTSKERVLQSIKEAIARARNNSNSKIGLRATNLEFSEERRPRILGVFTGQGAQWPGMAQTLIKQCAMFRETIDEMERALAQLPDPPEWSLKDEILKPPQTSRMGDAELSLPICAAVQVGLVQLLRKAGIAFHTVVGHSGGEIGAAYAVGTINEIDAVKIAYYRGIVCKLAVGADGRRGSMIAVGFGYQEGLDFCATPQMKGRLTVAASNSPKSVTLAGDKVAVMEAKQILDKQSMFNRMLQVDTGYHSHHMLPCAEPYIEQLKRCNVVVGHGDGFTAWVSSVYPDNRTITPKEDADMAGQYWTDNLIGRVLFSQALERALEDERGAPDMILEVGPHPALRGPSLETVRTKLGFEVPYSGVLDRKLDDITAMSNALGSVWTHLGSACVDFYGYASAFAQPISPDPLPDLPTYAWDHKQILWRESRLNKQVRSRQDRPHELLGSRTPDDTEYEPRWRNFFKLDEMPWLRNHRIQNQIIVPAAAYCVMALEAAKVLGRGKPVQSIELLNVSILRPIVLDEASEGTETLLSLRSDLDGRKDQSTFICADFSLSSGAMEVGHLKTAATGEILIYLGIDDCEANPLPKNSNGKDTGLIPVNVEQFYESLDKIGLNYSGAFRSLTSVERRMNLALAEVAVDQEIKTSVPVHPTWLDVCFQTFLAAFAAPRDDSLWTAFMPTAIGSIKFVNPDPGVNEANPASVKTRLDEISPGYMATLPTMTGDMEIYNSATGQLIVLVEDFKMSSFLPATQKDDKKLYLKTAWQQDVLSGIAFDSAHDQVPSHELELIDACETLVRYYLHKYGKPQGNAYLDSLVTKAKSGQANILSESAMRSILEKFGQQIDIKLIKAVGEILSPQPQLDAKVVVPNLGSLGHLITQWHNEGLGFAKLQDHFVSAIKQIAHKHEKLRVLQIGSSSTNLVKAVCQELEHTLGPYTVVDGSAEALKGMKPHLVSHPRVNLHTLDIESEDAPSSDVVTAGSFDVVIVHKAFQNQAMALKKIRALLRPGGFLVMMAATGKLLRFPFFLAPSPPDQSSLESGDSNQIGHVVDRDLQDAGFSGIDSIGLDSNARTHTFSVVVSQALDDRVRFLRAPLTATPSTGINGKLLVLGGSSDITKSLLDKTKGYLSRVWKGDIVFAQSLADIETTHLDQLEMVLSVTELDQAVLQALTNELFTNLQRVLAAARIICWVTQGARSRDPYQSSTIGLFRTFQSENLQKHVQLLDLDTPDENETLITNTFLRFIMGVIFTNEDPHTSPLWTIEEEVAVEDGKLLIPRIFLDEDRNRRLNALRRRIETEVTNKMSSVTLYRPTHDDSNIYAAETITNSQEMLHQADEQVTLKVDYVSLDPVVPNYDDKQLFCCLGHTDNGHAIVALSTSQSSTVTVPLKWTDSLDQSEQGDEDNLESFARVLGQIKSRILADLMPKGPATLLYDADTYLAEALMQQKELASRNFAFLRPRRMFDHSAFRDKCIELEKQASSKSLKARLPQNTMLVIDSGNGHNLQEASSLRRVLPANIFIVDYRDVQSPPDLALSELLSAAIQSVKSRDISLKNPFDRSYVISVAELVKNGTQSQPHASIVDWTKKLPTSVTSIPIQTRSLFTRDKTYILVGLTGHIGQSMCRWMVCNGARHIVLTSRKPDQNATWLDDLLKQGAKIAIEATDVTNKEDVLSLRRRVLSDMPAIGGIANGAMVMGNSFFGEMSFETFQKVMAPKVDGSINLDEVFSGDDLDFFILFSSISAVTGQQGQANYAAANNFMVGLASQRRAKNLPASVIDIGMIIGLGFIQRSDAREGAGPTESALQNLDYMPVSERDLHHLLAEAILAGHSKDSPEVITGLHVHDTGNSPFWHTKALFSHLRSKAGFHKGDIPDSSIDKSLKEKLRDASGAEDTLTIMEETFKKYLASSLKLDIESIYTDVPIIDLGIDSLVAVEIRNFIFKETAHDVPVLKILGGSTIKQICTEIDSSLSTEAIAVSPQPPASKKKSESISDKKLPNGTSAPAPSPGTPNGEKSEHSTTSKTLINGHVPRSAHPSVVRSASLSLGQSRLWFLSQYLLDDTVLNCTVSYELSGKINLTRLQKSIDAVIKRHEMLRTVFFTDRQDGTPMQGTMLRSPFKLKSSPDHCSLTEAQEEFNRIREYRYNLEAGDTFVATLLSHSTETHTLIFGYHHLIMDGVSWQVIQKDLAHYYDNSMARMTAKPLPVQYIDFAEEQRLRISEQSFAERLQFFQEQFGHPVEPLPLFPFARVSTRKTLKQYNVRETVVNVPGNLLSRLKQAARSSQTTLFHVFLSVFQVLLHRLLDVDQICIGMVDANRSDNNFQDVVGFFLETIPILFQVHGTTTFEDLLQSTRNKVYASLAQTGVPIEEILRACNVSSSTTETPLFQVCFNYRMGAGRTASMKEVDVKFGNYSDAQHPFDLVVSVDELDDGTARVNFSLQEYLYDNQGAKLLVDTYIHILEVLSSSTTALIQDFPVFDMASSERSVILGTGPNLDLTSSLDDTLSKLAGTWSRNQPETVAVKDKHGDSLSYAQMDEKASNIAKALLANNDLLATPIAVLLEPCVDTIATILGILRAGATYIPLDVRNPDEALTTILEGSGSQVLVYHSATNDRATKLQYNAAGRTEVNLVALEEILHSTSGATVDASTPDGIAMILFTSGSTGKPKGIPMTNANIRATILGASETASLGKEIVLQQSGQGFDAAIYQIFTALANGGTIVMGDNRDHPAETAALMAREGVTCTTFIVSEMQAMLEYAQEELRLCSAWHISMVAGELFTKSLLDQFRSLGKPELDIINAYGPTEASICTSMHRITPNEDGSSIPIGKALSNHSMYIVDYKCKPVPVGWPGEIVVGGPGVTSGYLNLPESTSAKFVQQSSTNSSTGSSLVYKTGDQGRMLLDGSIVMSSRLDGDEQVKIRGMRVNLRDVSQAIVEESLGNVRDAAVTMRGTEASKRHLLAYALMSRGTHISDKRAYLSQLRQRLSIPDHMRPVAIVPLDSFPMTVRGKLDLQSLASLPLEDTSANEASDDELQDHEAHLRDVWRKVLGDISSQTAIHKHSEFFAMGGNSLLLLQLKAEIRKQLGVDVSLPQLFQASTLELQAASIAGTLSTERINWDSEVELSGRLTKSWPHTNGQVSQNHQQKVGMTVLLTGSTGYVGTGILQKLVDDPRIDTVHCVAIRTDDKGEPRRLSVQSSKIVRHAGDLTTPNLSLTQEQFHELSEKVDIIIHNGAEVSHMKNYRSLRAANVSSTIELARMAVQKRVPFHYISTGGVARLSGASSQPEASLAGHTPAVDGSDGYVASKWASEVLLEKISERFHIPVWIHRPSSVTSDNVATLDIIHSLLEYSRLMKAVPDLTGSTGALDFVHLDTIATAVAACAVSSTQQGESESQVSYMHHCGEKIIPLDRFKDHLEGSATGSYTTLSIQDWVASALAVGLDEIVGSLMLASKGVITAPLLEKRG